MSEKMTVFGTSDGETSIPNSKKEIDTSEVILKENISNNIKEKQPDNKETGKDPLLDIDLELEVLNIVEERTLQRDKDSDRKISKRKSSFFGRNDVPIKVEVSTVDSNEDSTVKDTEDKKLSDPGKETLFSKLLSKLKPMLDSIKSKNTEKSNKSVKTTTIESTEDYEDNGEEYNLVFLICNLHKNEYKIEEIAEETGFSKKDIEDIIKESMNNGDYKKFTEGEAT